MIMIINIFICLYILIIGVFFLQDLVNPRTTECALDQLFLVRS